MQLKPSFALLALVLAASVEAITLTTTIQTIVTTQTTTLTPTTTFTTAPDAQSTSTSFTTTTLEALTQTLPTTLPVSTVTTTTAPAATQTNINKNCTKFKLSFAKNCCPTKYCKKKKNKNGKRAERALLDGRAIVDPPTITTGPCSSSQFLDFDTYLGQRYNIVTNYNFIGATILRVQDLYGVNVCGDIYLDGNKIGSTNCPARNGANTNDNQSNPDAAIASGNYAFGYFTIPAGVHSISFEETYQGGVAYYQLTSTDQCPLEQYFDQIATVTEVITNANVVSTSTVAPTSTVVIPQVDTLTSTLPESTAWSTVELPGATQTILPAPIQTTEYQCKELTVRFSCPNLRAPKMLDNWMQGQLNSYKRLSSKNQQVSVTCVNVEGEYYYD